MKESLCNIILRTPIGFVKIVHSSSGVREMALDRDYDTKEEILKCDFGDLDVYVKSYDGPWHKSNDGTIEWLKAFFSMKKEQEVLKRLPSIDSDIYTKDNFTGKVLRTLANDIPAGKTVSYAELACLCGSPKACRAVGQAMRANPVPLIVPCHRVISSNGSPGHYMSGKGDSIKKWLLNFEKHDQDVQ